MAQKVFFTRKTSLTLLFLLFLRNLNICCICCDCCYDDLLQKEYSFILDDDSKEKNKDDFSLRTEKWKEKNKKGFDFKPEINRTFSSYFIVMAFLLMSLTSLERLLPA